MGSRMELGRYGEELAEKHLVQAGMEVLDRNWRCSFGEIDLVALDGDCLVVCEVKTRSSGAYGSPWEAVTPAKLRRLRRLCVAWVTCQDRAFGALRIDVVGIVRPRVGPVELRHLVGVG